MTDKVQKIREVIEKRYEHWKEKEFNSHSIESEIRMSECQHLLLMVDSLQEDPVSEELEKDINIEIVKLHTSPCYDELKAFALHFIEWQKYQMMKDAVNMTVGYWMPNGLRLDVDETENDWGLEEGDKAKIIIVKEN